MHTLARMPLSYDPANVREINALSLAGTLSLRNACVEYFNDENATKHGRRVRILSLEGVMALVHGWEEYRFSFHNILQVRPALESDRERIALAKRLPLGLALQYASFNLGHQVHHTLAAWAALHEHAEAAADAEFLPIPGAHVSRAMFFSPHHRAQGLLRVFSVASWMLAVRGLSKRPPEDITHRAIDLVTGGITCFDRIEGGFGGISAYSGVPSALANSEAWKRSVLRNSARQLRGAALPTQRGIHHQLLYVARQGRTRQITNDKDLVDSLGMIRGAQLVRVLMEEHSLSEQLMIMASSSVVVGVHGMGLVHTLFLPSASQRTALIEIQPGRPNPAWGPIFRNLVEPRGVNYTRFEAHFAKQPQDCAKCRCTVGSPLECNVTVKIAALKRHVVAAVEWIHGRG